MPRTVTGAPRAQVASTENLTSTLWERAGTRSSREILRYPADGAWRTVTWPQLAERVRAVAAGLVAAGVSRGDRVVLMANTRVEWTVADLAILAAGAVTVPAYETSSVGQCEWILSDSEAVFAFAGTADHAKTLDAARGQAPALREVVVFDDGGFDALAERATEQDRSAVDERVAQTGADELASLIYTSGTTGNPKGCMLTHGNLLTAARGSQSLLSALYGEDQSTLLFLPLAHVFARLIQFGCLESNTQLGYARSVETLSEDLQTFRPTFLVSVPRVFEKVFTTAQRKATGSKAKVFDFAVATAREYAGSRSPSLVTKLKRGVADKLVYGKLRDALGGRVRYCISGGAPLSEHLAQFFHGAGITILEGYGLTETSAATTVNTPTRMRIGTVGVPQDGVEVAVADDGELLIKGPQVFRGYWHNEQATREVTDADGWFRSGDLGDVDDQGFVRITGRKKELIVTAAGKNVAPAVLEERLKSHRLVSQALVVGDNRPFIGALVTLDAEELATFAAEHNLTGSVGEMGRSAPVREELAKAVDHANAAVSRAESIRKVTVLDRDFGPEYGEVTPTLKLKRAVVADNFAAEIDGLYAGRS